MFSRSLCFLHKHTTPSHHRPSFLSNPALQRCSTHPSFIGTQLYPIRFTMEKYFLIIWVRGYDSFTKKYLPSFSVPLGPSPELLCSSRTSTRASLFPYEFPTFSVPHFLLIFFPKFLCLPRAAQCPIFFLL